MLAGSLIAILGASGSGKTTLLRVLAGFERADGGMVQIGAVVVDGPNTQVPRGIAAALGSHDIIELDSTSASLQHAAAGRSWSGPIYLAAPSLLRAFGIKTSQINPAADILTMRPGLSGLTKMQLIYGNHPGTPQHVGGPGGGDAAVTARDLA